MNTKREFWQRNVVAVVGMLVFQRVLIFLSYRQIFIMVVFWELVR